MVPAESSQSHSAASTHTRTNVLLLHSVVSSEMMPSTAVGIETLANILQETTTASEALVEGKLWGR